MSSSPQTAKFNWREIRFGEMFNGFAIPTIQNPNGDYLDLARPAFGPQIGNGSDIATAAYNVYIMRKRIAAHEDDIREREEKLDEIAGVYTIESVIRKQERAMKRFEAERAKFAHMKAALEAGAPESVTSAIFSDSLSAEQLTALANNGYRELPK